MGCCTEVTPAGFVGHMPQSKSHYLCLSLKRIPGLFQGHLEGPGTCSHDSPAAPVTNEILNMLAIAQLVILLLSWTSSYTLSTFSAILLVYLHSEHLSSPSVVMPLLNLETTKILLFPLSLS